MSDERKSYKDDGHSSPPSAIREFIVEFLGSLVPGVAFLIAVIPAFVAPIWSIAITFLRHPAVDFPTLPGSASVSTIIFLQFPLLMGFFVIAYIAGHLFYRQNPKTADAASFKRISDDASKRGEGHENKNGMVRELTDEQGRKRTPVEFPYHFLYEYLDERGIDYLANRVPWDKTSHKRRAKHFANALKLRIQTVSPEGSALLARNEAHIRLSSSMWYVCRTLIGASWLGLSAFVFVGIVSQLVPSSVKLEFSVILLFPIFTLLVSHFTKVAIERSLHYQREREILFILEVAHWLFISDRAPKMFEGLGKVIDKQVVPERTAVGAVRSVETVSATSRP